MLLWIGTLVFLAVIALSIWYDVLTSNRLSLLEKKLGSKESVLDQVRKTSTKKPNRLLNFVKRIAGAEMREEMEVKLRRAGEPRGMSAEEFLGIRFGAGVMSFAIVSFLGILGMGPRGVSLGILTGLIGYMLPGFWIDLLIAKRKKDVEKGMLNFVNMLAVASEAGLSLSEALSRVSKQQGGQLKHEIERIQAEVELGKLRREALRESCSRYDSADLYLVFGTIAQAEEHGTPIVEVLRHTSEQLREQRKNRAQELAQKAAVKILFPILFFMFLPLGILMMGPAVLNLMESLML